MNKSELIHHMEQEWQALAQSYQGLTEATASQRGGSGEWSVKDILGHVATWEEAAIEDLGLMMQGRPTREYDDTDAYNREEVARKASLSFDQIQRQMDDTHHSLMAALAAVPEERWASDAGLQERVESYAYDHSREHSEQIQELRKIQGV